MGGRGSAGVTNGLVVVDKPTGWTSHDVVGRVRRIVGTRRVGHAGTLDPMATGVLVLGVERATKLLGHLALTDKSYTATIRLGESTVTDDAEGEVLVAVPADRVTEGAVRAAMLELTGRIEQVPSQVSAIKVDGKRSYARVRSGEQVVLAPRAVTVSRFELVTAATPRAGVLDVSVQVHCSTGTYVRALARDLGARLGVGGHLTVLRRTRVGPFDLDAALTLEALAGAAEPVLIGLDDAVAGCFPRRDVDDGQARAVGHGGRLPPMGLSGPYGVFGPDGHVIALMAERDGVARSLVVLNPA
ncbi:MAG: tRNA pseudouridine(55) synthase TruB [Geodermatophilaceae bacterium]|nr:tRNA pseudouridine(55) synthase TruB [Geodermatophilaceae bacterium]